jgi:hypothetical protein
VLAVSTTKVIGVVSLLAAVVAGQARPYRVVNGQTDSDGFPTTSAKLCIKSGIGDQCYSPPSPESPLPPFALNATAKDLKLATGAVLIVFTAESSSGGSGSLTSIALLEDRNGKLLNLLPKVTLTNQSEYHFWNLPAISAMAVLVTADFVWGEGETHFSQHHYRITSYVYGKQAGRYVQRDQYVTERKYSGLDNEDEIKVLAPEKANIIRRLQNR